MLFITLLVFADFTSASSIAHENVSDCSEDSICAEEYSDLDNSSENHDCVCHSHIGHSHLSLTSESSIELSLNNYSELSSSFKYINRKTQYYISQSIKPPIS